MHKEKISLPKPYFNDANGIRLYMGDSLEIMKAIPNESIDTIFADPPYFLSNGTFTCKNAKMVSVKKGDWDLSQGIKKDFSFHLKWLEECRRILKPNGTIWLSGTYHSIYQCGFAIQILGFHILNDIAWLKPNASPNLSCRFFTASHETLIWAKKDKKAKHTFNYEKMVKWENNYKKQFTCKACGKKSHNEILHEKGKQMRSVWAINTPRKEEKEFGKHPTQKSLELLKRIIVASTNEKDLILDPFTGSSTTGVAAKSFNRRFIGIDLNKEFMITLHYKINHYIAKNTRSKNDKKI